MSCFDEETAVRRLGQEMVERPTSDSETLLICYVTLQEVGAALDLVRANSNNLENAAVSTQDAIRSLDAEIASLGTLGGGSADEDCVL